MIFWDTSAVVPLCVDEPRSVEMLALLDSDQSMVVWWGTPIECWSAICRRLRDGDLNHQEWVEAEGRLDQLGAAWTDVLGTHEVRDHARRLLRRHPLRAADAMQLAAAMVWAEGKPEGQLLACLDDRLSEAAVREGFTLATPVR